MPAWGRTFGCVAGEEGFEPSNGGIKIRCLNQLGDSPALNLAALLLLRTPTARLTRRPVGVRSILAPPSAANGAGILQLHCAHRLPSSSARTRPPPLPSFAPARGAVTARGPGRCRGTDAARPLRGRWRQKVRGEDARRLQKSPLFSWVWYFVSNRGRRTFPSSKHLLGARSRHTTQG